MANEPLRPVDQASAENIVENFFKPFLTQAKARGALTQRNLAPDPFFKRYRSGERFIDGYPATSATNFSFSGSVGSPFGDNVVLRFPTGTSNANSNFSVKRLGLKIGDRLSVVIGVYAQQGVSFTAFLRSQTGSVLSTALGTGTTSFVGTGEYKEVVLYFDIDAAIKTGAVELQVRSLVGQTSTSTVDICGYGIFLNSIDPALEDLSFNDTDARIRSKSNRAGLEFLAETHKRLGARRLGFSETIDIALIGDSYTHVPQRWSGHFANYLKATYGDAGLGWIGLGYTSDAAFGTINGSVSGTWNDSTKAWTPTITFSKTGTWVPTYGTLDSPDTCGVASSEVDAEFRINGFPAAQTVVTLFAKAQTGVVAYSVDNGTSYTNIDLSGTGTKQVNLVIPNTAFNLRLKVISGSVELWGLNAKNGNNGVRVHKLGATGTRAQQWAALNANNWQANITALAPNLVITMLAANDQAASRNFTAFRADYDAIWARLRTAVPSADLLAMAQPENGMGYSQPMNGYSEVARDVASSRQGGFIDLQPVYGRIFSEYSSTSARPWFNPDNLHPEPANNGGVPIAEEAIKAINF